MPPHEQIQEQIAGKRTERTWRDKRSEKEEPRQETGREKPPGKRPEEKHGIHSLEERMQAARAGASAPALLHWEKREQSAAGTEGGDRTGYCASTLETAVYKRLSNRNALRGKGAVRIVYCGSAVQSDRQDRN